MSKGYSLCWQGPQATANQSWGRRSCLSVPLLIPDHPLPVRASLSSVSRCVSMGLCEIKWVSFMCSGYIWIKGSSLRDFGGLSKGAVMSVNAATKAFTHDKFPTQEVTDAVKVSGWFWELVNPNCHQCWQGPHHRHCVYTSWYQIVNAEPKSACSFYNCFIAIASCCPIIALAFWCRREHCLFSVWHWLFPRCWKLCGTGRKWRFLIFSFFFSALHLKSNKYEVCCWLSASKLCGCSHPHWKLAYQKLH